MEERVSLDVRGQPNIWIDVHMYIVYIRAACEIMVKGSSARAGVELGRGDGVADSVSGLEWEPDAQLAARS